MNWNIIIISNIILAKFKEFMYRNLSYFKSTPWIKEILWPYDPRSYMNTIFAIAQKIQDFKGVLAHDLTIPVRCSNQLNCGYEIKWSYDPCSYEHNFWNSAEKPEKFRASTGVETLKPLTLRTGHLWFLMFPWGMNLSLIHISEPTRPLYIS